MRPLRRNSAIAAATAAPSRSNRSNSSRSKLLDTWMSMLGDQLGSTARISIARCSKKRVRMSLRLEPTTSWLTFNPIRFAA